MSTPDPDDLIEELREAAAIPLYDERGNRFSISDLLEAAATRIEDAADCARREVVWCPGPSSASEPAESEDARLWRMAAKVWSRDGLSPADVAAEGFRLKPERKFVSVADAKMKVADRIGGGFDRVGSALVAELRRIFEPIPKG